MTAELGCVLLTMGDRPEALARAVASVRAQASVTVDVLVVVNGDAEVEVEGARVHRVGHNLGIPAGRNLGLELVEGEVVLFLDDDAWLEDDTVARALRARFAASPDLAVVSLRIADEHGHSQRRHVPRLRAGDPARSSAVTTFLGGAAAVRRRAFEEAGGLPEEFVYAHEETSLAWRLVDRGWRLVYDGALVVRHPRTPTTRHAEARRLSARNRVLLARRHLPWPLAVVYVANWLVLTLLRDRGGWRATLKGLWQGLRWAPVAREPISWRGVWRLTRTGRPPVL